MLRTDDLKYDDPVLLIQEKSNDNNISFVRQFIIDIYYFWEDEFSRSSLYVFLYKYINFLDDQWYKFIFLWYISTSYLISIFFSFIKGNGNINFFVELIIC